jgi:hypothetical protein
MHPRAQCRVVGFNFRHVECLRQTYSLNAILRYDELPSVEQMNSKHRQKFVIITAIIAAIHLLLVSLGALGNQLPGWLSSFVVNYTYPLFPQPWSAGATDIPTSDMQLEFRTCTNESWTEWQDAGTAFNYTSFSIPERIEQSINDELRWQILNNLYASGGQVQFDHITESSSYAKALYFVLRMQRYQKMEQPDTLQMRAALRFTPDPEKAYTFQRTQLEFPKFAVPR